ncbi:MAG: efflux RND transporter periplasmic adaptor subunit [Pseudoxanthomonas sp.]|nr:efflux RND transporter periplasmic adaptor subunit [Pseudoxanthomonas sp.]
MHILRGFGTFILLLGGLAGCDVAPATIEAPRPVLVLNPGTGVQPSLSTYAGVVRAREQSSLSFRVGGKVVSRSVDAGTRVSRGQVLAELDAGDLSLQAQAGLAQLGAAEADLARARGDRDRYAQLVREQLVSRSVFDAQEAAYKAAEGMVRAARAQWEVDRNQAAYTQLSAPSDGVIASRQVEAGQVVAAGETVFTMAADGGREVVISLPEGRIREFKVGQPVLVELWSAPGRQWPGTVREISPEADEQLRTFAARVNLDGDAAQAVELGQSARVYVQDDDVQAALSVPLSAVQRGADGASAVWLVDAQSGKVKSQPVQLGRLGETEVPVISGLKPDDWVVAAGGHLLREGQAVLALDRENRPVRSQPQAVLPAKQAN